MKRVLLGGSGPTIVQRAVLQAVVDLAATDHPGPGTASEIAAKAGYSVDTTRKHIQHLRKLDLIGEEGFVADGPSCAMSWGPTCAGRAAADPPQTPGRQVKGDANG